MWLNGKNAFSRILSFTPKNFGGPYLSPTWHRGRSVLKIIIWISSLLTNIYQPLGKHNKDTRASKVSWIENFENLKILPFWTHNFFWCKRQKIDIEHQCQLISMQNMLLGGKINEKIANLQWFSSFWVKILGILAKMKTPSQNHHSFIRIFSNCQFLD